MFSVLVIRLRSLRLLRVSGIVMRLRMFLLLITFLKASHSFRNRLLVICKKDRKSGSAGMPRPISYAVFCLKKKKRRRGRGPVGRGGRSRVRRSAARPGAGRAARGPGQPGDGRARAGSRAAPG